VNSCRVTKVACTAESAEIDCPSGWTCVDNPEGVCFDGPDDSGCTPADPPMVCSPPYADLGGGYRGSGEDDGSSGTPTGGLPDGGATPPNGTGGTASGQPGDPATESGDSGGAVEGGGCSVSRAPGSLGSALAAFVLTVLGFAGLRRRRR
jgi:MYXO-CTERM domain-containing protein